MKMRWKYFAKATFEVGETTMVCIPKKQRKHSSTVCICTHAHTQQIQGTTQPPTHRIILLIESQFVSHTGSAICNMHLRISSMRNNFYSKLFSPLHQASQVFLVISSCTLYLRHTQKQDDSLNNIPKRLYDGKSVYF